VIVGLSLIVEDINVRGVDDVSAPDSLELVGVDTVVVDGIELGIGRNGGGVDPTIADHFKCKLNV